MMNKTVAIVEDEADIVELLSIHLSKAGYAVRAFPDGKTFFDYLHKKTPDLIILDLMLPDIDGLDICKRLRKSNEYASMPIIMLTARGEEMDRILGLELGADDYVTKPFSPKELVSRVKAVLRRNTAASESRKIEIAKGLVMDLQRHEVSVNGKKIDLTLTEFKILELLASKKGWVFTRDKILDFLWGDEKAVIDRTVDVHIRHLRGKLGDVSTIIKNVRGLGYKLEE